jgi:hypothetical protein
LSADRAMSIEEIYSDFANRCSVPVIRLGDEGYRAAARVWNGMFDCAPAIIVKCRDGEDVQASIRWAGAVGISPAIRCGGHSLAGFSTCNGGMVIDLSQMREIQVDAMSRSARFGGGSLLGTVDIATQEFGLAFPAGVVSHTGAAGLILGGGTGWLSRRYGLSCDNVVSFTLVLADGSLVRADGNNHPDLFWALRGGGGNFGVVTEFEVKLHPVSSVLLGRGLCPVEAAPSLLRKWREFMPSAPDNLRWSFSLRIAGNADPAELYGQPVVSASVLWVGEPQEGYDFVNRALTAEKHSAMRVEEISFLTLQTIADSDFPHGRRYYTKSGYFRSLHDGVIDTMLAAMPSIPSMSSEIELSYLGGAVARVDAGDTAFGDRSAPIVLNILSHWVNADQDSANIGWTRRLFANLRPWMSPGVYVNFMSGDETERIPEAYRERWERLREVKTAYDPGNLFRLNQNIPPRKTSAD